MKCFLLPLLLLISHALFAQPCNCNILNTNEKGYFADEREASALLNRYMDALWGFSRIRKITDPFVVKEAICPTAKSALCETMLFNGRKQDVRLILYNNYFLKRLNQKEDAISLVDKHVLLHELGHHVLGHHKNGRSFEALNLPYEQEKPDPKSWSKYGADNPMALELEADIYAVWALSKLERGFSVQKLIDQFSNKAMNDLDKLAGSAENSDHPIFKDRIATMIKFEAEMKRKKAQLVTKNYFADIASTAYLALWPESYVYDVSITAGTVLAGSPNFSVNGEKTDAFLYPLDKFPSYHIGLSVSRFRWDKPLQTEFDVQYSQHKYGTRISSGDETKLAETLKLSYVTFTPKITWNSIGASQKSFLRSNRVGFVASLGINARVPVGVDYTSFIANTVSPEALFSIGPKVSIGAAIMKKSFLPRGFKVLFSYDPHFINLKATPKPKAISHNVECTLQYSIFRR